MSDQSPSRRTALITGASSGIGADLAPLFAADGFDLVLTGRNVEALERVAAEVRTRHGVGASVIPEDLADPAAPARLVEAVRGRGVAIHTLVNNAGFGSHGPFADAPLGQQLQMLQVNVVALTALTRLLLPAMVEARDGRVLNVASVAGFLPGPLMAVYYASKAYVLHFSEAIAEELRGTGVTVTALCPGPTSTDFQHRAGVAQSPLFSRNVMDSSTVARLGYAAMKRGKVVAVTGWKNALLARAVGLSPRKYVRRSAHKLNAGRTSAGSPNR